MGKWKKTVAAIAALPVMIAGLALGPVTAMAADNDGGLTDANLVASYDFEDANDKGKDISGNNNDLTVKGENVEYGVPGDHQSGGNAIQLRGNDGQYLELPNGLLNGTDSFTVQFDSKSRMAANDNFFSFTIGSDNQKYFFSRLRPTSVYTAITKDSNGNEQGVTATQSANVWHTYRISVSPTFIATFIDGNLAAINKNVTTKLSELGTDLPMNFGKSTWAGDKYYNGGLDNIKIWKAAYVSDGMVWDGVTLPGSTEGSVTLPAKDALGNTITWSSSNTAVLGNDGTLVKAPAQDTDVTFTAKSTVNGIEYTKTFAVNVAAAITAADAAAERLLVDYQLTAGATLPTAIAAAPDAKVTWKSSDTSLVKDDGTVVGTDGDAEKTVDLTATVTLGTTSTTKKFTGVRVMPKSAQKLSSYTRDRSINGGSRVGNALHLALNNGTTTTALNTNYGVAFAEAKINATANTESTEVRGLVDPYLFQLKDGKYAYVAVFTDVNGNRVDGGQVAFSTSSNLTDWSGKPNEDERGDMVTVTSDATLFDAGSIAAGYDASAGEYRISWKVNGVAKYVTTKDFKTFSEVKNGVGFERAQADLTGIDNAVAGSGNAIALTKDVADSLTERLGRVHNTGVEVPTDITVQANKTTKDDLLAQINGGAELDNGNLSKGATATATYSDGSTFDFRVNWNQDDLNKIDLTEAGTYEISGTINQQNYSEQFPMMSNRADPNIVYYNGKYYAMGTSDTGGMKTLFIRSSDTLAGLKDQKAGIATEGGYKVEGQDVYLFGENDGLGHKGYHWAPELHVINGKLYCFYATFPAGKAGDENITNSPNWAGPSAYVMELKDGGDPTKTADWLEHRVQAKDGGVLSPHGLSIDMTYFEAGGKSYIAWSQGDQERKGAKANVSIAEVNSDKPWQAITEPQRLMRPEWGWELDGVNEGPNVLVSGGKVYMVFSAQLVTPQYATGMLIANVGDDLTDPASWTKSNYPWLHNGTFAGQFGLGHNSYFTDPYGDTYNVYHAMTSGTNNTARHAGVVPVHFRADGTPIIDMTTSEELDQSKKNVTLEVVVTEDQVSSDATLKSLNVVGSDIDLDTAASTEGAALAVDDSSKVTDADVQAVANDANAKATVAVANNVVTVTVTAQDGTTVKVYRVVLTKKAVAPDPEDPTDPDSGKDDGDKNTGKGPDKGDKPGADLSETGAAVLGLGGAVVALAVAGISLTIWRKRRA
ncbi:family 43 glycosylhydrolase [Bifidobacterium longum]|uniref:family 43 glycosylhydrolase n=1 Tax=Bifidobacterium longum TaxID=216816 RepID=UPI00321B6FD6|nr:family 43 glycosylhydrolase [Bifidobacterium longum]MDB6589496.1 family 43 glycosylhydrolase [Bifidobacterium longum]MDB6590905.1 family 43 glycosylhydrolase [Bifidobacterium longum]